jgi:hypothetical protein
MPTIRSSALALLTEPETQLVLKSAPRTIPELSKRELKQHAVLARRLQGKYLGLAQRQEREARRKVPVRRGRRTEGSHNTARKAELFGVTRERFEQRLEKLTRAEAAAAAKAKPKPKAARAATRSAETRASKAKRTLSPAAKEARGSAARAQRFNLKRRNAQTSARVRKSQARSDSR